MTAVDATPPPSRSVFPGVMAATVGMFALVVAAVTLQLRSGLQTQVLQGHAETLAAVAALQLDTGADEIGAGLEIDAVPGALFVAVLKTARFRDVIGVRVFDLRRNQAGTDGLLVDLPPPTPAEWARVVRGETAARLRPRAPVDDMFVVPVGGESGVAEIWVPLRRGGARRVIGAAQLWIDARSVREELAAHDDRLWVQAAIAWVAGAGVIVVGMAWAFRRIERANRELRARTEDLQRANRELTLAAKTSALGAVTAHLIHELKTPIAGLESLVAAQAAGDGAGRGGTDDELAAASQLTGRLRRMVNDVVGVLRDEQTDAGFELTLAEIAEVLAGKVAPEAAARGIAFSARAEGEAGLPARRANLAGLILRNLVQNALEAAPAGTRVDVRARVDAATRRIEFEVADEGPGLPAHVQARLFQPCTSSKAGGSGLGLALSQQLAQHAGGRLELVRSDGTGTCFRLVLAAEA